MNILEINLLLIVIYAYFFLLVLKFKLSKKLFLILTSIQLIIINGLRDTSVGNDTYRYLGYFNEIKRSDGFIELWSIDSNIGYKITQKFVTYFTDSFNVWLIIVAIFIYFVLALVLHNYSKGLFISYVLFIGLGFYDFSFTGIRQAIAIILVLSTYKYIIQKKMWKFFALTIIASLFHTSALVSIPLYFIAHIKWKIHYLLLLTMSAIFVFIFRLQIGKVLTVIYYDENTRALDKYESTGSVGGLSFLLLIILVLGVIIYNPTKYRDKENVVLSNIMIVALYIQFLSSFSYLFTRLNMFFLVFIILYLPNILNNLDKLPIKLKKYELKLINGFIKVVILSGVIIYYLNNFEANGAGIFPFYFFWEI